MTNQRGALVTGTALGVLGTLLANKTAKAAPLPPPPEGVDPSIWEMLFANLEATASLTQAISSLVSSMGGDVSKVTEDPFENTKEFTTGQVVCTIINRGFQLPQIPIPKNKQLIVKAMPGNTNWVWIGVQQAQAQTMTIAYPLLPNEGVGLFIKNASQVWVMATVLNDAVAFIVEQI